MPETRKRKVYEFHVFLILVFGCSSRRLWHAPPSKPIRAALKPWIDPGPTSTRPHIDPRRRPSSDRKSTPSRHPGSPTTHRTNADCSDDRGSTADRPRIRHRGGGGVARKRHESRSESKRRGIICSSQARGASPSSKVPLSGFFPHSAARRALPQAACGRAERRNNTSRRSVKRPVRDQRAGGRKAYAMRHFAVGD